MSATGHPVEGTLASHEPLAVADHAPTLLPVDPEVLVTPGGLAAVDDGRRLVVLSDGRPPRGARGLTRGQVWARFVALNVAIVVLLLSLGVLLSQAAARREAVADAARLTDTVTLSLVQPAIRPGLVQGDPDAYAALDEVVRRQVLTQGIARVKIWTREGRIVYSDESRIVGETFPLGEEDLEALDERLTDAEVSDLGEPENRFERGFGKLLEVYRPVRTPEGEWLLFEVYAPYTSIEAEAAQIFRTFAPVTLGTAVLLGLTQWPLVSWMFGQMDATRREREALLEASLAATDEERRRIVGNLHDGIVQDLTGASLLVSSAAATARRTGEASLSRDLDAAATVVREGLRGLRSALVEIYPPSLAASDLPGALSDLVAPLRGRGCDVSLDVPGDADLPASVENLLFRTAQEALRNVTKHSGASRVDVVVTVGPRRATLEVSDDGTGFAPPAADADGRLHLFTERDDGTHVGLNLLADVARSAGARLELRTAPGRGTTVRVEVPL